MQPGTAADVYARAKHMKYRELLTAAESTYTEQKRQTDPPIQRGITPSISFP
jgi:hypothetical protein